MDKSKANLSAHGIGDSALDIVKDIWYVGKKDSILVRAFENATLEDLVNIALICHSESDKWMIGPHDVFETTNTVQLIDQDTKWQIGDDHYMRPKQVSNLPGWMAKDWYESSKLLVSK